MNRITTVLCSLAGTGVLSTLGLAQNWGPGTLTPAGNPVSQSSGTESGGCAAACTQNLDNTTITSPGLDNCPFGDTSYIRLYDPVACGLSGKSDYIADAVNFGIELAFDPTGSGAQPANVRLHSYTPGAPFTFANFTLLHDEPISILDTTSSFQCVPFSAVTVPAGQLLVVELFIPPAVDTTFLAGGNFAGQTDPWFFASQLCGLPDPTPGPPVLAEFILDVALQELVGTSVCSPALPNSTGEPASIFAVEDGGPPGPVTLLATGLPQNETGYFLASDVFVNTPFIPPGSSGNFCLGVGPNLGRYSGNVRNSGSDGKFSLPIDPTAVPWAGGPGAGGPDTVDVTGLTWYFSCWYRDGATTNFTDVVCITFALP